MRIKAYQEMNKVCDSMMTVATFAENTDTYRTYVEKGRRNAL